MLVFVVSFGSIGSKGIVPFLLVQDLRVGLMVTDLYDLTLTILGVAFFGAGSEKFGVYLVADLKTLLLTIYILSTICVRISHIYTNKN